MGPLQTEAMRTCASVSAALIGSICIGAQFVGCLYLCAGPNVDRNSPAVIKQRFVRVGLASVLAPILVYLTLSTSLTAVAKACVLPPSPLRWFGLLPHDWLTFLTSTVAPLALTMLLFLGPLFTAWLDVPHTGAGVRTLLAAQSKDPVRRLVLVRNLLVGPLAEEWVFRACICPLLFSAGISEGYNVLASCLIFGAAHIHHRFDAKEPWLAVVVQFTYTSLFGAYSSYLFLRTGLVFGPIAAHTFCNSMGLPHFADMLDHYHKRAVTAAYLLGAVGFTSVVGADAWYRPCLFGSIYWNELGRCSSSEGETSGRLGY